MSDVSVSRTIKASAATLWAMVADLPRMGEWSPESTGGRWKAPATGPAVGARFTGTNRKGIARWSTRCTVTECEAGSVFAFEVTVGPIKVARWGYTFAATGAAGPATATIVTETWTDRRNPIAAKITELALGIKSRAAHNRAGMERTLENLAAAAEA